MSLSTSTRAFGSLLTRPKSGLSTRSFAVFSAAQAPYRTSTGEEAVLPVHVPLKLGGKKSKNPAYKYVDYRDRQTLAYPFSKAVRVPFLPPLPAPRDIVKPPSGTDMVGHVNTCLKLCLDTNSFYYLFSKHNKDRILPGSILTVTSYTTSAKTHSTTFTGALVAVVRKGINTSFTLRNVVLRTGVEMRFECSSPLVKDVKLLVPADGKEGNIKKQRLSKLYYYRDQPERLADAAKILRAKNQAGGSMAGTVFL
ncbi:Mitochondrial/chloroplast ribosomal protein L19 [Phaffia rhodozyma]|uniref:Mitochondrial/chloroplast ribosomal protein L19 n=1 Tax=Phaffia rhodozyma TaxID=264483 RepID=A0A0F7SHH9_PHARH|nr:Mitochondrial/chloroplast ribosomal protein L19 [Phaffia rhodozyma]